jgi:uncharacterized peroxidase-related enzyme
MEYCLRYCIIVVDRGTTHVEVMSHSGTSRIQAIDPDTTEGKTKDLLDGVNKMLGGTPNLFRVTANAPAALEALVGMFGATAKGKLNARTREAIALAVAEANGCDYCLSAHTALGKGAGLAQEDIDRARDATSSDPKTASILRFARSVVAERGKVSPSDLDAFRRAGGTDGEAMEVVANVVLNVFTNYVNLVADTEIDFPVVRSKT